MYVLLPARGVFLGGSGEVKHVSLSLPLMHRHFQPAAVAQPASMIQLSDYSIKRSYTTRAKEEQRRTCAASSPHPRAALQNQRRCLARQGCASLCRTG